MTFLDDLADFVSITFFPDITDPASELIGYILAGVTIAILIAIGISIGRYLKRLDERPPGKYLGLYTLKGLINESGERTSVTAHMSLDNQILTPKMLQDLKRITDIEVEFPELLKLATSGELFICNLNPTEFEKENVFKENKKAIAIFRIDPSDKRYYYEDAKGEFSFTGAGFRSYPRTIDCFGISDYAEIQDPHGDMVDVYRVAVVPNELKEKLTKGLDDKEYSLEIIDFPQEISAEILGTIALMLPSLVASWKRIEPAEAEADRLRDKIQKLRNELADVYRMHEPTKHRALRKSMVGYAEAQDQKKLGIAWGWRLAYFISGVAGILVIPQITFLAWLGELGGAFVGLIIIFILNYIIETKGTPDEKKPSESNELEA